jgi:hypothetical protein
VGKYEVKNSCPQLDYYQVQAYQWNAGTSYEHPAGAPGAAHCEPESSDAKFHKNSATAATFNVGFSVQGVGLMAQSGYTTSLQITFIYSQPGQICGTNNDAPEAAIAVAS